MEPLGNFPLYHWSPSINRLKIAEQGLRIRSQSTQGDWKPPFLAFGLNPQLAWLLSAGREDYEVQHKEWDLWSTWSPRVDQWERLLFDADGAGDKELRVYKNIPAKHLWYVGSRSTNQEETGQGTLFSKLMADLDDLEKPNG